MVSQRLKILLIEDDPDMQALIKALLARELPRAQLSVLNPIETTLPTEPRPFSEYDCILVNYDLGSDTSGLDWLRRFDPSPEGPAVILLTGADDAYVAARAMKLGAEEYLNKRDLSARRLAELITTATASRRARQSPDRTHGPPQMGAIASGLRNSSTRAGDQQGVKGYILGRLIGRGSTAQVYLAERTSDGLTVVIKLLRSHILDAGEIRVERFIREASVVAGLQCPQIVRIYEQQFTEEAGFIAMEYLPGGDLRQRIEAGIPPGDAVQFFREILLGLAAIHEVGVIHRDLKPGNIMFRSDGSLALADFGLSKRTDSSTELTMSGQIMGTPAYMSPEQGEGHPAGLPSDLYSAGAIFYEMLCGRKPYEAATVTGVIYKHITAPIPRLPAEHARYQPTVDALLAKSPQTRPESARAALMMLDA